MLVHRQEREPSVVGLVDRPPRPMLVDVPNLEVFQVSPKRLPESAGPHSLRLHYHLHSPREGSIQHPIVSSGNDSTEDIPVADGKESVGSNRLEDFVTKLLRAERVLLEL